MTDTLTFGLLVHYFTSIKLVSTECQYPNMIPHEPCWIATTLTRDWHLALGVSTPEKSINSWSVTDTPTLGLLVHLTVRNATTYTWFYHEPCWMAKTQVTLHSSLEWVHCNPNVLSTQIWFPCETYWIAKTLVTDTLSLGVSTLVFVRYQCQNHTKVLPHRGPQNNCWMAI